MNKDFRNFAVHHLGMNGLALDQYAASAASQITSSYISPTIIEERQLNVAQMDVFSRLMMDRIIFLSTDVNDYTATVVQGQLLYLDSVDPGKDISIYLNSPGGSVIAGLGFMTPCNTSRAMSPQSASAWQHQWRLYFLLQELKASAWPFRIRAS